MTNKDREKLEAVLAPLRGRISKEDFMELATMHIQRAEDYIICSVKEFTADRICYECYETYYRVNGIVILSAEEKSWTLAICWKSMGNTDGGHITGTMTTWI